MKKLILLGMISLVVSCKKSVNYKEDYKEPKTQREVVINSCTYSLTTASDGHDYLSNGAGGSNAYMCMHYIDCVKCAEIK